MRTQSNRYNIVFLIIQNRIPASAKRNQRINYQFTRKFKISVIYIWYSNLVLLFRILWALVR